MRHGSSLQTEAAALKQAATVVAVGIGTAVSATELNSIASAPQSNNVILAPDFNRLTDVEGQLRSASCTGQ